MLFFVPIVLFLSLFFSASSFPLRAISSPFAPAASSTQPGPPAYSWSVSSAADTPGPSNRLSSDLTTRDSDPVNHGLCSIHVRQVFGDLNGHLHGSPVSGTITASLHDGWHMPIGDLAPVPFDYLAPLNDSKQDVEMTSKLPYVLTMEMSCEYCEGVDVWHGEHMRIRFVYGAEWWMSNADGYCIEGWADKHMGGRRWSFPWERSVFKGSTPIAWTRDLDCSFRC
ncbi:hypothetical protein MMC17_003580 [Xylographa soralifera]|nr:hypothetical protein [Xylographa soralifera]